MGCLTNTLNYLSPSRLDSTQCFVNTLTCATDKGAVWKIIFREFRAAFWLAPWLNIGLNVTTWEQRKKCLYIVQLSRILKLRGPEVVITRINKISSGTLCLPGSSAVFYIWTKSSWVVQLYMVAGKRRSGYLCLDCCPCDTDLDGWMDW